MEPRIEPLQMFGAATSAEPLDWSWVRGQLVDATTYWVVATGARHPHPRPVWGVWHDDALHLSVGTPLLNRRFARDPTATVHLDSGLDVVIVEGRVERARTARAAVAAYDAKYDWRYDAERYGDLTPVAPTTVLSWRAAGPAGRDGFLQAGRFRFG